MLHFELQYDGASLDPADYIQYPQVHAPEAASDLTVSLQTAMCDRCGYADILEEEGPCQVCGEGELLFYELTYSDWRYAGVTNCSAHNQFNRASDIVIQRDLIKTYKGEETRSVEQNYIHIDDELTEADRIFLLFHQMDNRFALLFDRQADRIYAGHSLTSAEGDNYERRQLFRKGGSISEGAFYLTDSGSLSPDNADIRAAYEFGYTDTASQRIYDRFQLRCVGEDAQLSNLLLVYQAEDGQNVWIPLERTGDNQWSAEFEGIAGLKIPSTGFRLQGIVTRGDKAYAVDVEL